MDEDGIYLHLLGKVPGWNTLKLVKICRYFKSGKEAFFASESDFQLAEIDTPTIKNFLTARPLLSFEQELETLAKENLSLLSFWDDDYPILLKEIVQAPPLLYYRGVLGSSEELCIAVVGTRKITTYGRITVPALTKDLVKAGLTLVSGLAYGVDAAVHKVAVDSNARTIAVLGCGLDQKTIYPNNHVYLTDKILAAGGLLLSEYPPGTPALRHHFIARNRIISGLSVATLVIECNLKSGTLITAKHALDQNRTVYAVPGPLYAEQSKGPNNLIKMGAQLVTEAMDILNDLHIPYNKAISEAQTFGDNPVETSLLKILSGEPTPIQEIIHKLTLPPHEIISTLTFLEMKGRIKNVGAQQYVRVEGR